MTAPTTLSGQRAPFETLGARVASRLVVVRFVRALRRTALPVAGVGLLALAAVLVQMGAPGWAGGLGDGRWGGLLEGAARASGPSVVALVVLWLAACALYARLRKPAPFDALALWDERAGRGEAFASAWAFGRDVAGDDVGRKVHIARAERLIPSAEKSLARELPVPRIGWRGLAPLAVLGLAAFTLVRPPLPGGETRVGKEMAATAVAEADRLAREADKLDAMEALTEEEREEISKLKDAFEETTEALEVAEGKSAEDVLDDLEARAREAEKMADKLAGADDVWASDQMIAEMREHADTADLADAIKDKDAGRAAGESDAASDKLADPELTRETRDRIGEALGRTMEKATEEDHERLVGEHVGRASGQLERKNEPAAAQEFEELAARFREIQQRENAQKQLEELAEKLREAGANIANQNVSGMQKLAGNEGTDQPEGSEMAPGQPNSPANAGEFPMGTLADGPLPAPGLNNPTLQDLQNLPVLNAPVPGTMPQGQMPEGDPVALVPGDGEFDPDSPMALLPAPVPGTKPTAIVPGAGQGQGSPFALPGGLRPGVGTTEPTGDPTAPETAARQGNVAAQINADGESTFRAVEGGQRDELATRARQALAVEFLSVQEEALDEQPLPVSRRDHVRRYFNAVRERYESAR